MLDLRSTDQDIENGWRGCPLPTAPEIKLLHEEDQTNQMKEFSEKFIARFWKKVEKTDGCWNWTGAKNPLGYGSIGTGEHAKTIGAHVASWLIHYGIPPEGHNILHHCDNPSCVRPDHLFTGTQKDNHWDMRKKGRWWFIPGKPRFGEENPMAKLTAQDVREIRRIYKPHVVTRPALARRYGVCLGAIDMIIQRENWKHI